MNVMIPAERQAREAVLRDFLHDCAGSTADEQGDRLREAAELFGDLADRRAHCAFEAMLACGAYESAALALLGDVEGFILSRGANGACLASVLLPDGAEEVTAQGASLALALLQAHVCMLLAQAEPAPARLADAAVPAGARLH